MDLTVNTVIHVQLYICINLYILGVFLFPSFLFSKIPGVNRVINQLDKLRRVDKHVNYLNIICNMD